MDFERSAKFEEKRRSLLKELKDLIKICKEDDNIPEAVLEFYKETLTDLRAECYDLYNDDDDDDDDDDEHDQLVITLGKKGVVLEELIPRKKNPSVGNGLDGFCVGYTPTCKQLITFPDISAVNTSCRYVGKGICFTGFTHEEKAPLEEIIKLLKISKKSSISSKVELLVCGNSPGPAKVAVCKDRGIPIISADEFIKEITLG